MSNRLTIRLARRIYNQRNLRIRHVRPADTFPTWDFLPPAEQELYVNLARSLPLSVYRRGTEQEVGHNTLFVAQRLVATYLASKE